MSAIKNPKAEIRRPKEGRNPKAEAWCVVRDAWCVKTRVAEFRDATRNTQHATRLGFRVSIVLVLGCGLLLAASSLRADSIVNSKHNLAISGPGDIKAVTETEICIFCHTPHQKTGEAPLWNHRMPVQHYTPYKSSTLKATDVNQPTGASKLCLSCHDGTVALGMVSSRSAPIAMQSGITTLPARRSRLGTDLSDDHPVSFRYGAALATANLQLKDPSTLNQRVRLDADGQMQCTSCHDPHNNQYRQIPGPGQHRRRFVRRLP